MTKQEQIIAWFKNCPAVDDIQTEQTDTDAAGLYRQASSTREALIDGTEIITDNYYVLFKRNSSIEKNRLENVDTLETVEEWITTQNQNENYPFDGVFKIEYTGTGYMIATDETTSTYQITLSITYMRGV